MQPEILPVYSPDSVHHAARAIQQGRLVAYPTDTVYGLGANVHDTEALERVVVAKQRPEEKAFPVLIADREQVALLASHVPDAAQLLMEQFWPGALTLVLPKRTGLSARLGEETVAVRLPAYPPATQLIRAAGCPITGTSANTSGQPPAQTPDDVVAQLGGHVAIILDGGPSPGSTPSTVLDCTVSPARILRDGAVTRDAIAAVLGALAP